MKAMIDGRIYDTDQAEEIARFTVHRTEEGLLLLAYHIEDETIAALARKAARAILRELDPDGDGRLLCWGA